MAKYAKIYENDIEKHELVFRGKTFDFSMLPSKFGTTSDKAAFSEQIAQEYQDISAKELEDFGIDDLWSTDEEDEIFEILDAVSVLE